MLEQLIEALAAMPQGGVIRYGFGHPSSYRGFYSELGFEPVDNAIVSDMLAHAKSALGQTFTGWKGGEFTMHECTDCYIADYGDYTGDQIGPTLLKYWAAEAESKHLARPE